MCLYEKRNFKNIVQTKNVTRSKHHVQMIFFILMLVSSIKMSQVEARVLVPFRILPSLLNGRTLPVVRLHHGSTKRDAISCSTALKKQKKSTVGGGAGFYYGLSENFISRNSAQDNEQAEKEEKVMNKTPKNKKKIQQRSRPTLIEDILSDTLTEFRSTSEELRDTLDAIRQEMAELSRIQKKMMEQQNGGIAFPNEDFDDTDGEIELSPAAKRRKLKKRRDKYDRLAREVEEWAEQLLFEEGGEEDGWKEIECSKLLKKKFNSDGKIKCFVKVSSRKKISRYMYLTYVIFYHFCVTNDCLHAMM